MVHDLGDSRSASLHPKLARFLAGDPPCTPFTHRDHVEVAWRLLQVVPLEQAVAVFCDRLRTIATAAGVPEKFDATMTWGYLVLIDERRIPDETFDEFAGRNTDLLDRTHPNLDRMGIERAAPPARHL